MIKEIQNYPALDLEAAARGEKVILFVEPNCYEIGHIYKSYASKNTWIFETNGGQTWPESESALLEKARMYNESAVFQYWHLIAGRYKKIKRTSVGWVATSDDGSTGEYIGERGFIKEFFPDCPVGTVITRPA